MIYLASAYTHPDPSTMAFRYDAVCRLTGKLLAEGKVVYSPIAYCHHIQLLCPELGTKWENWEPIDRKFLELCDEVWVFTLDGWDRSEGVLAEINMAHQMGKPVRYIDRAGRID